ncbi:hypothetical protein Anas_12809 [Armadillidium nasatum]|uniref:G-protein coupled receptors family 1 profile domain-containing protein n=1 Tax=Armadillidium nasatum TaxID=96803 RepID=A0A5N5TD22_9CRUS|nr:hypothetical protein Anas_12809 [Armadillidium nasatum]
MNLTFVLKQKFERKNKLEMTDLISILEDQGLSGVGAGQTPVMAMNCEPPSQKADFYDTVKFFCFKCIDDMLYNFKSISLTSNSAFLSTSLKTYVSYLFFFSDLLEGKMTKVTMIALLIIAILTIFINLGVIIRVIKLLRKGGELKPTFLFIAFVVTACEETICTISLIAIDKYIFICHGISYRAIVTKKRVRISILITWIYSLLIDWQLK